MLRIASLFVLGIEAYGLYSTCIMLRIMLGFAYGFELTRALRALCLANYNILFERTGGSAPSFLNGKEPCGLSFHRIECN